MMPFLFYNTLADSEMKQRMEGDLIEFYGIVSEIHEFAGKGTPLAVREKVVLVLTPGGEYGFLLWPIVGILWGLWRGMSYMLRTRKLDPVSSSYSGLRISGLRINRTRRTSEVRKPRLPWEESV